MRESAINLEGIDTTAQQHVRIQLRVVTSDGSAPAVTRYVAPRGFLPEAAEGEVAGHGATNTGGEADYSNSSRLADSPGVPRLFGARRKFLAEPRIGR